MEWVRRRLIEPLFQYSLWLIVGAAVGFAAANIAPQWFHEVSHWAPGHFLVNEILMALFFALVGKEILESFLPGGALNGPKKWVPLIATAGGVIGPALVYTIGALLLGKLTLYGRGWGIPTATDIAFSAMVGRMIFGANHPAVKFLLVLAVADDLVGIVIIALFYPQAAIAWAWLLLPLTAVGLTLLMARQLRIANFWAYLAGPGVLSWLGFLYAGIHPALGLLPVVACMPHAKYDAGIFDWHELNRHDTLSEMEHWWNRPVQLILCLFGFYNAGVQFTAMGDATWLVLAGLVLGKTLFIWLFGMAATLLSRWGLTLPEGMKSGDLLVMGSVAGIGFTVALFVAGAAFPPGPIQDAAKIGAFLSLLAIIPSFILARLCRVRKMHDEPGEQELREREAA